MKKSKTHLRSIACLLLGAAVGALAMPVSAANLTAQLTATYRDIKLVVFGEEITPTDENGKAAEPFIVGDTTYLPIRAVSEALGYDVSWDEETNTVSIGYGWTPGNWMTPLDPPDAPSKTVTVSNAAELIRAIAPDTKIILKAGKYDLSEATRIANDYVTWETYGSYYDERGSTAVISGVEGLTLEGEGGAGAVELVSPFRYESVLNFESCNGITLTNLKAGHSITGEYECDQGVSNFYDTQNLLIEGCEFYGSGAWGLDFSYVLNVTVRDTTVTDCSFRAVRLDMSDAVTFEGCKFTDNRAYGDVISTSYSIFTLRDCEISGNHGLLWGVFDLTVSDVTLDGCVITDNENPAQLNESVFAGSAGYYGPVTLRLRDTTVDKAGFESYWTPSSQIVVDDQGGNTFQ